jgi:hypothetical protein
MAYGRNAARATPLADGTVLVTGGEGYQQGKWVSLPYVERFDPKANTFTTERSMSVARFGHAAVRLQDGRVLVLGGLDDKGRALGTAEVFDPATGAFSLVGRMAGARTWASATLLPNGRVLVVGGWKPDGAALAMVELFDPTAGAFQRVGSLARPRAAHAAVALLDGRVAILGGLDEKNQMIRQVEIYDPVAGVFAAHGEIAEERGNSPAALLPDGRIVAAGGFSKLTPQGDILGLRASVEIYDPATGQSAIIGNLTRPRFEQAMAILPSGEVLVSGGWQEVKPKPTPAPLAELIDPGTGQITVAAPMSMPRAQASAVRLQDGRVLVLGGVREFGVGSGITATAEVYVP